ncbi:MAG: DMT family transporter [Oscillospiraceae bacterium]|nr:DMT family transporter [Oscillospiraceae bacterium]
MEKRQLQGHIAAAVCVCTWGVTFVAVVHLLQHFSPFEVLFFRFGLATLALYLVYPKRMRKTTRREELLFAGAGLAGVTLYFLAQDFALLNTSASNVGVIVAVSPVFTGLLTWRFLGGGRPTRSFFAGFLLAICGIGLISFAGSQLELHPIGDLLAVSAALCWAVYCIFTKKISGLGHHIIQTTRRIFLYGLVFLLPVLIAMELQTGLGLERFLIPTNLGAMLFLGLGASASCFLLWNFSLKQLGPVKTSAYIYLVPLVTVAASVLFLGERVTWTSAAGIALTLVGLVLSNRAPRGQTEKV